jgi:hypothetical protein
VATLFTLPKPTVDRPLLPPTFRVDSMSNVARVTESASAIRAVGARLGLCNGAQGEGGAVGRVHRMSRPNGGIMSAVPTTIGVFFGQVDKRAEGWYWAHPQSEKLRGAIRGPFETKQLAVADALLSVREGTSDEPQERGAA